MIEAKINDFERKCELIMERFSEKTNRIINNMSLERPSKIKLFLQHHLNELHLYCKMRKIGIDTETAKKASRFIYKNVKFLL